MPSGVVGINESEAEETNGMAYRFLLEVPEPLAADANVTVEEVGDGQVVAFFTMVVAACEVVIGLAIIMTIFRTRRSASVDAASLLKH